MSCATLGFSAMISVLLMVHSRAAGAEPCLQSVALARTHTRARAHDFNVPNEKTAQASPREPPPAPARGPPRIQVRRSGVHGKGVYRAAAHRRRRAHHRVHGRGHHWPRRCAAIRTTRPTRTIPSISPRRRHHVIDAKVGGNASRWINHACEPNCEADDEDGRVFIKALRDIAPGEELFYDYGLVIDERYTPKLKKRVRLPLRQPALPRHDAGPQAALRRPV
jgi:uncharacterized protein